MAMWVLSGDSSDRCSWCEEHRLCYTLTFHHNTCTLTWLLHFTELLAALLQDVSGGATAAAPSTRQNVSLLAGGVVSDDEVHGDVCNAPDVDTTAGDYTPYELYWEMTYDSAAFIAQHDRRIKAYTVPVVSGASILLSLLTTQLVVA